MQSERTKRWAHDLSVEELELPPAGSAELLYLEVRSRLLATKNLRRVPADADEERALGSFDELLIANAQHGLTSDEVESLGTGRGRSGGDSTRSVR